MNKEIEGKQTTVGSISCNFKTPREHEKNKKKTYLELKKGFQAERTLASGDESMGKENDLSVCVSLHRSYGEASRQKRMSVPFNHG